jgi:hypothetical protein
MTAANTLAAARQELRLLLGATGVTTVYGHVPERVAPPVALLEPGAPYMTQGDTFCDFVVRFNIVLLVRGDNETATAELDDLICSVIDNIETWDVDSVEQPSSFDINNTTYLGTRIAVMADKELST